MDGAVVHALLQTAVETPGVGPEQLRDVWPIVVRFGWFLASFLLVGLVGWYVFEPAISRTVRRRNRNNPTIQEAISRYVRLLVLVVATIVGATVAGYGDVLADSALVLAAATLALGVAGQEVIGSLISGLVLVRDPEFNVGHYIEWAEGSGTVRSITLRVTRVETPDGELVTIPNTVLTSQPIKRPFGRGRYRIVERIGIAYEDDVEEAMGILRDVTEEIDDVLPGPEPDVYVHEFGSDGVVIGVHYWIEDPERREVFEVRSVFARRAKERLEAAGITISPASKRELQGRIEVEESP